MSVVASYVYRGGVRQEAVALDGAPPAFGDDEFVWVGLFEPTMEEIEGLARTFGLHPLAVEDALNAHQVPKVEVYGDQIFVIAKTAHLEGDKIRYGETSIFVGHHHIITVRHGSARAHTELRAQIEASPQLMRQGTDYVLHAIIDFIVDGYLPVVQTIEDKVLKMEKQMLVSFLEREQIRRLFRLRRQLILFGRILGPMSEVVGRLVNLDLPCLDQNAKPFFRDVLDHVRRVESMVGGLREVITSVFEASNLLEQQRQGVITRQLAAWAAILAVPTAIAGIYGMNFENMPELKTHNGYFIILAVIVALCSVLYYRFRKTGWL
ncbi:MAG: magnesium and cobalt transport protein CorA [Rhizobiales bacterium 63-7]|uniref:magnesium/cobalt transporter CorA n=1 Tax=Rhizobium sp. YJ-22 TaxID=3037556 RepID=UPI00092647AA|nr:magnesium/cobalt transporter CorA [Rhizobium sp. YJ-22]MBN9031924.1 magnesium/cobalt transporter CorA [Hyphomicrobiales bacterium]MDG3578327.1 magnesium/cobalt transporter CorA [Rhizobium sp. YJ-22]OJU68011.1 MAG: magnesium and cobalt transport protein CorA [Rhizobiales bacterium 63-7]